MLLILLSSSSNSIANNRIISIRLYSSAILSAQTNSGPQMPIIFLSISFPFRGNRSLQSKRRYFCPSCCHKSSCLRCIPYEHVYGCKNDPGSHILMVVSALQEHIKMGQVCVEGRESTLYFRTFQSSKLLLLLDFVAFSTCCFLTVSSGSALFLQPYYDYCKCLLS